MTVLITGVAGFIGMHVGRALLRRGACVLGIDDLNNYYDVNLKRARIQNLSCHSAFQFFHGDIAENGVLRQITEETQDIDYIIHLAAQAGVRYSLQNPTAYARANVVGHLNMLELARDLDKNLCHFVYASSSSVYGSNLKLPFSISDRVDQPVSLYAATKRADELMSHAYSHTFGFPATGLRYFTVYGPWGRPDMAIYNFTSRILAGRPIEVFNGGDMSRSFTYIDDVVAGTLAALDRPPRAVAENGNARHALYNLGNQKSERLRRAIAIVEESLGRKAEIEWVPMQPGDVPSTAADIELSRRDLGYDPSTTIDIGIPRFIDWFRSYHRV